MGLAQRGLDFDFEVLSHDKLPKGKTLQVEIEFMMQSSNGGTRYGLKEVSNEISLPGIAKEKLPQSVKDRHREAIALQAKLQEARVFLQNSINTFQAACPHKNEKKVMHFEYMGSREQTLKHFMCPDCGRIRPPRRGSRIEVCKICDGDMKYMGRCRDEDHTMIYQCKICGHTEEAT